MKGREKDIVVLWSGGIDSTALIAQLLQKRWNVHAVIIDIYKASLPKMAQREKEARTNLLPALNNLISLGGCKGNLSLNVLPGDFLWAFSPDGIEIPRRNKRCIDHIMETLCIPRDIPNIGMGEYIGVDTWVVRDHVPGNDCDHRSLSAYLFHEYGTDYRFVSLADFGPSRYKKDRVAMGASVIGVHMYKTTNCLGDTDMHCGRCYKCIERHVAMDDVFGIDETEYIEDPKESPLYNQYLKQMGLSL